MRSKKWLILKQTEEKLKSFGSANKVVVPEQGWIKTIRSALNMTLGQLSKRLHMTPQGVKNLELREASGAITLKALRDAGDAMDLKLVYGFVPKHGSLEKLIEARAESLARKIVERTNHHMMLEDQGANYGKVQDAIAELTEELKREMKKSLWD